MDNLKYIHNKLKDKYDLILTNTFALDVGFTTDYPVLCGKHGESTFYLYEDDSLFVFFSDEDYDHFHPHDVEEAVKTVTEFMEGTAK